MIDLKTKDEEIYEGLKDFQKATVDRVYNLLTDDFTRVLVADEVGLGKTMIARGVMAKIARYHQEVLKDPLFKVVYVCSNQSIARQNLQKLQIDKRVKLEDSSDTRLSMQHLKIFENDFDEELKERFIQLIPLTPSTSFNMTSGCGSASERALMYLILKEFSPIKNYLDQLDILLMDSATKSWEWTKLGYEKRVEVCNAKSDGQYLNTMLYRIEQFFDKDSSLIDTIHEVCERIKQENVIGIRVEGANQLIFKLRRMMAEISVDLMDPDLVIMDEFQRFPELVNADGESETALLAKKFFNSPRLNDNEKVKILLLSATPYKLYSTLEEISEKGEDEHYKEFMQVTGFLFEHHPEQQRHFKRVWEDFSSSLNLFSIRDIAVLQAKKQEAEDSLYRGIARTERMAVEGSSELINASLEPVKITKEDVLSYVHMDRMLQEIGIMDNVPVDYVKSTPFLMSFMEHYKLKQKITRHVKKYPENLSVVDKPHLWIKRGAINRYKKLPDTNARLTKIKEIALPKHAERLLWIPPSLPYYEFGGCYSRQERFSKLLIFSGWEMVPRAVSTLLSYESERLTVGELIKKTSKKKKWKNRTYFAERRFPQPRLSFAMRNNAPANMNHLTLLYPSITLAKLFNPIDVLNKNLTLEELKSEIADNIQYLLDQLPYQTYEQEVREDERWYYLAPLLLDQDEEAVKEWFNNEKLLPVMDDNKDEDTTDDKAALTKHLEELRTIFQEKEFVKLGKQPKNLKDVLVNMVLGSPAICALRMFNDWEGRSLPYAVHLAKILIDRFNTQESISIVELEYGNQKNKERNAHWQNVLKYCVDGNIQAMLDEYAHMLIEEAGLRNVDNDWRNEQLTHLMTSALSTHSATYNVDTYESFKKRVKDKSGKDQVIKLRTNYAVGFADKRNEDTTHNRKKNVRLAFNSPFRPFVLVTTSVGQEGLDFHYYCRKIVHWNLPSNPVDLEQREGRINRYKCFAIRQNIANKYGNIPFENDVWQEMFTAANKNERNGHTPELVPFWSLPENQDIKIERIVPIYPLSKDGVKYERLMKIMQLYRLSLGQARQEELLEYLFKHQVEQDQLQNLFMNLSPYYKEKEKIGKY
ncbi:helicase C-terminal domain-containing protein [Pseudalkalibacillus salsuginis]|uniref:helicase C-terminal domain-containing protein n=1 Tax=Pseudalkalibacillus salsuginis TaxID=2910972 RepID=UPI001F3909CE|nr:helicase C-terminal domain-containing protein [Pseudalkalibacillus salsuginis]MCF6409588.1 DEAD/DEAH box helicase family protein [Pseudalkalibacillus salsuginis]